MSIRNQGIIKSAELFPSNKRLSLHVQAQALNLYYTLFIRQMLRVAPIQRRCEQAKGRRASRAPGRARTPRRRSRGTGPRPCSKCWPIQKNMPPEYQSDEGLCATQVITHHC